MEVQFCFFFFLIKQMVTSVFKKNSILVWIINSIFDYILKGSKYKIYSLSLKTRSQKIKSLQKMMQKESSLKMACWNYKMVHIFKAEATRLGLIPGN